MYICKYGYVTTWMRSKRTCIFETLRIVIVIE